jgi:hypothetical protein
MKVIPVTYLMKVIPVTYLMKVIPVTYLMKVIPVTYLMNNLGVIKPKGIKNHLSTPMSECREPKI